jgi:tetratricopeptide (TPR) repeat protein
MNKRIASATVVVVLTCQLLAQLMCSTMAANAANPQKQPLTPAIQPQETAAGWEAEYQLGSQLSDEGKDEAAAAHLKKALDLAPKSKQVDRAKIELLLGEIYYQNEKEQSALPLFEDAVAQFENHPESKEDLAKGYEMLSRANRHLGRPADAELFGIRALNMSAQLYGKDSSEYALNLRNMGKLYLGLFRYSDAEEVMREAIEIFDRTKALDDEQFAICLDFLWISLDEQGKDGEARQVMTRLSALEKKMGKVVHEPPPKPNEKVDLAPFLRVLQYSIKRCWDAPKASEACRTVAYFIIHRNGILSDLKIECPSGDQKYDQSCVSAVEKAFASPIFLPKGAPDSVEISFTFERTVTGSSDVTGLATSKRVDPVGEAMKLIERHNYKEARAILSMPDLTNSVRANVAQCKISSKLGRLAEAEKYAHKAIAIDPSSVKAHVACAEALIEELKFPEAITQYRKVLELKPHESTAKDATIRIHVLEEDLNEGGSVLRASILLSDLKAEEAVQMLTRIKAKHPRDADLEYYLSSGYSQQGKPEEALKHIRSAIELDPNDIDSRLKESWIEQALGHGQASMNILRDILKRSPPEPKLSYVKELIKSNEKYGVQRTENDSGPDYFADSSEGQPRRWNLTSGQPLKVYIASGNYVPGYTDEMRNYIVEALNSWSQATNGKIRFNVVDGVDAAQIVCAFKNDKDNGEHAAEGGRTYPLGGCAFLSTAIVYIETEVGGAAQRAEDYRVVCLHEMGHALGLGHSRNDRDIMYFAASQRVPQLTQRDKNTIAILYSDNLKFPEWALLDERGLTFLEQYKPRDAIRVLVQAKKIAPQKEDKIDDHLARAYCLAVCENLSNRSLSDSNDLVERAMALNSGSDVLRQLNDLKKLIVLISSLSDHERTIVLDSLKDKLTWPPK